MTLGNLLDRFYAIVGDDRNEPTSFPRQRVVDLMNEGFLKFRGEVEDAWYNTDIALQASVGVYPFNEGHLSTIRIAYDDVTLEPATIQELLGIDSKWQTRVEAKPRRWTTDDVSHDEFRLYPVPETSSTEEYTFSQERGVVGRWQDDGVDVTFIADPLIPGQDPERGVVGRVDGLDFTSERGAIQQALSSGAALVNVWGVQAPPVVSADEDTAPVYEPFYKAALWYALWQTYTEQGDHYSPALASYYEQKFLLDVERAQETCENMMRFMVAQVGWQDPSPDDQGIAPWPSSVDFGSGPQSIGWPRREWW